MNHSLMYIDSKRCWASGYRYRQTLKGLALARLPDGKFHRVGYITCDGDENVNELLVEQVEKLEFTEIVII